MTELAFSLLFVRLAAARDIYAPFFMRAPARSRFFPKHHICLALVYILLSVAFVARIIADEDIGGRY